MRGARILIAACLIGLGPPAVAAQEPATVLRSARRWIEAPEPDSAIALLTSLIPRVAGDERSQAYLLFGAAYLQLDRRAQARQSFVEALRLSRDLRVDDQLEIYASGARALLEEVRRELYPAVTAPGALVLTMSHTPDVTLPIADGRFAVQLRASRRALVKLVLTPADSVRIVWSDSVVGESGTLNWNLRERNGQIVAAGRYTLQAVATDAAGSSLPEEHRLVIERVAADTAPQPPQLLPSAFLAETLHLRRGSPAGLGAGLAIAAAAAFLPTVAGNAGLKTGASYTAAYAVGGAVSVASIVGFLRGSRTQPVPANILENAERRQRDEAERRRIVQENARLREGAPVRIRVEGGGR